MSLVDHFEITLKDFLPDPSDRKVVADRMGATTIVSNRLYARLRAYADDNQIPLDTVVEQLREEIHRPPPTPDVYDLTCPHCGHTGEMYRMFGLTTAVTGFQCVRVYRNGTVVARCAQCGAFEAVACEPSCETEKPT